MSSIFAAAYDLQLFCQSQGWQFCFIGGIAVQCWGNPRHTQDADLTLLTGFGGEERYIRVLLQRYTARIEDAELFALETRVLLLYGVNGVPLDISLGAMPFEERTILRASPYHIDAQQQLSVCSAEDLIIHKAFANRTQDWFDIEGIVARQGRQLQWSLIWEELEPLVAMKEEPTILDRLRRIMH